MRNRAFLRAVFLGLLIFALVPGLAGAAGQGQDLTGMLSSSTAERATAVSPPLIDISPSDHDFGRVNVGATSQFQFTVTNLGEEDLDVSGYSQTNGAAGFVVTLPPAPIPPGGFDYITVDYGPVGSGPAASNISIFSNDPLHPERVLHVRGSANNAPYFTTCPASTAIDAYVGTCLTVIASDPEYNIADPTDPSSDHLHFSYTSVPPLPLGVTGPTFGNPNPLDEAVAQFCWTPAANAVGTYVVTFQVDDGPGGLSDNSCSVTLTVRADNLPPVAATDGPYVGIRTIPIDMSGAASTDPDGIAIGGEILDYAWDFGDGNTGAGKNVSHPYAAAGVYVVSLTVTDHGAPALSNTAITGADVSTFIAATIVQSPKDAATGQIRTGGNGGQQFGLEIAGRPVTDIDPATIRLSTSYPNAGTAADCGTAVHKVTKVGDLDGNLVFDLDFWIKAADIGPVLIHVPNGATVEIVVLARTVSDNQIVRGTITLKKKGPSGVSSAAAPNPFKPETSISYSVERSGNVSVRIFSVGGQLVRSLREEFATAGTHEVRWNGKDDGGRQVPSGTYFVSVRQGSEASTTRVVLAR